MLDLSSSNMMFLCLSSFSRMSFCRSISFTLAATCASSSRRVPADRSAFSTLTVRIHELGADAVEEVVEDGPQLGTYVETARNTLIDVIGGLLVIATVLLPFLLLGLGVWAIVRTVRRRRPPVTAQPYVHPVAPPAAPEEERVPEPQG